MLIDVVKKYNGLEVDAMTVYSDMFRISDAVLQKKNEEPGQYKANPIGYWKNNNESKGHYRILFDDDFENILEELQKADFSIINGITYFGRKNVQAHASKMYALIFDLDGVTDETIENLLYQCTPDADGITVSPMPNYLILSGHGVHLYYIFDEPISLYPNIKLQLKELKYALTRKIWNRHTTILHEKVQYQGINQGFRVIGGKTKIAGITTRAFRLNTHPYTIDQLNEYVADEFKVDVTKLYKESKMSLEDAKKKYPEWYQKRVVMKLDKGSWTCKRDLYEWWIRQIKDGAAVGHRYFCIMCLAIYAIKSGVDREQLKADAEELRPIFNKMSATEPFTVADVESALDCYDERYIRFPREDIVKISGIEIKKNDRNGRNQLLHLKMARSNLAILNEDRGKALQGRLSKEQQIKEYLLKNPTERNVSKIAKELNVSRPTVYKYMK